MAEKQIIIEGEEFTGPVDVPAQFVGKKPYASSYGDLKVYIPSLMPQVTMGLAKTLSPYTINKKLFCNSDECAISPMSKVTPQNFVTAKSVLHTEFQSPHIDYGATIEIHGNDHDFQTVQINTNKDPTSYHP